MFVYAIVPVSTRLLLVLYYFRQLHRYPRVPTARGPAIFNPTSRLPTEAFNYQFPVGSVRDDQSDTSSSISAATTNRTQRTEGNVP